MHRKLYANYPEHMPHITSDGKQFLYDTAAVCSLCKHSLCNH